MTQGSVFAGLMDKGWETLAFEPFRDGVEICHLVRGEPALALLKYQAGARIPRHRHDGLETIVVLSGEQSDERGVYSAGTVVANPKDSTHSVWSDTGCVVLIQWTKPVVFV